MNSDVRDYLKHGFALVPLSPGSKNPVTRDWNRREKTITEPRHAVLLTGNVGIAHAYCQPCPTASLDVDNEELATFWLEGRGIILNELLNANDAVQIVSGKEGRAKLLYSLSPGMPPMESVKINGGNPEHAILEFRCATANGSTLQDVLPPSVHPETGKAYRWGGNGNWRKLPAIPATLLRTWQEELLTRHNRKRQSLSTLASSFKAVDDTPRQRARVTEMTRYISANCPYDLYRDIVWAHLSLGWHDAENLAKHWCLTAPDRFDEANFDRVVASYDLSRAPTIGTIIHHARQGGWHE